MAKLIEHAQAVLNRMVAESTPGDMSDPEREPVPVWEGSLSSLVSEVAVTSQYSGILKVLKGSGAIVQIKRGGGGSPSRWAIVNPNAELSNEYALVGLQKRNTLEGRVETLERLVGGVDVGLALTDHMREHHGSEG